LGTAIFELYGRIGAKARALAPAIRPMVTRLSLLAADLMALTVAAWFGLQVWKLFHVSIGVEFYLSLWPVLGVFVLLYAALGLYPGVALNAVEELRCTAVGTTMVYVITGSLIFLSKTSAANSRGVFLFSWVFSIVTVPLARTLARRWLSTRPWWGVSVLVVGSSGSGLSVLNLVMSQPSLGLKPMAYLDDHPPQPTPPGIPLIGPISMAAQMARELRIRYVLVAMPRVNHRLMDLLEHVGLVFPHVILVPDLFARASFWIAPRNLGGLLGLEFRHNLLIPVNRWVKRALDLLIAGSLGVLTLPLIATAAIWIKRVSPGPAFYKQAREGAGGKTIHVQKLRTMYPEAERLLEVYLRKNPAAKKEWKRHFKLKQDPRILPGIGSILRRTSIDELPQLWNVLKGEMSLVGPRALPYYHLDQFSPGFRALRKRVPPGLTGLWQVCTRSDGDWRAQEALDTYYIRNWSIWLDLHILARTIRAVVAGQGAY